MNVSLPHTAEIVLWTLLIFCIYLKCVYIAQILLSL